MHMSRRLRDGVRNNLEKLSVASAKLDNEIRSLQDVCGVQLIHVVGKQKEVKARHEALVQKAKN
jgi:hypothetical protein